MPRLSADPDAPLGRTKPNAAGHRYRHGTLTGYSLGRCRCDYCRDAYCRYRAARRADGKDDPRGVRACDTDGHIPSNWFRNTIWYPAVKSADLEGRVRIHDLRHTHATILQRRGVASDASFRLRCEAGAVRAAALRASGLGAWLGAGHAAGAGILAPGCAGWQDVASRSVALGDRLMHLA